MPAAASRGPPRRDDRSQARQHRSCPWGPQPSQPHTPPVPRRPISDRGPQRQGRLAAPATPAGPRSLTRPGRSPGSAAAGEQGRPRPQAAPPGPRASSPCPPTAGTRTKDPVKPRLTRPRSFRDDTEEVTGSNPVRPTIFRARVRRKATIDSHLGRGRPSPELRALQDAATGRGGDRTVGERRPSG